jgi:hypothetical protein
MTTVAPLADEADVLEQIADFLAAQARNAVLDVMGPMAAGWTCCGDFACGPAAPASPRDGARRSVPWATGSHA